MDGKRLYYICAGSNQWQQQWSHPHTNPHTNHLLRVTGSINCSIGRCVNKEGFTVWGKVSFMKLLKIFQLPHWCTDDTHTHIYTQYTQFVFISHTLSQHNQPNQCISYPSTWWGKTYRYRTHSSTVYCQKYNAMQYVTTQRLKFSKLQWKQTEILFHTAGLCSLCLR